MFNLTPWTARRLPTRREEHHPVYSLQREMNRLLEDFFPCEIDADKAEAAYKNGVLSIKPPKSTVQQKATKTIPVKPA